MSSIHGAVSAPHPLQQHVPHQPIQVPAPPHILPSSAINPGSRPGHSQHQPGLAQQAVNPNLMSIPGVHQPPAPQPSSYWTDHMPQQQINPAYQLVMTPNRNPTPRPRKPYTTTKVREMWSTSEHERMLEGLRLYKRDWAKVTQFVGTRSAAQVRSHAQKYFDKVTRDKTDEFVPRPRPKRKSATPYPRKPREDKQPVAVPVPVPVPVTPSPVHMPVPVHHMLPMQAPSHSPIVQPLSHPSSPYLQSTPSHQMYSTNNPSPVPYIPPNNFASPQPGHPHIHPQLYGVFSPVTPYQHHSTQPSPHFVPSTAYVATSSQLHVAHAPTMPGSLPVPHAPLSAPADPYSFPTHSHPNGSADSCAKCAALQRYGAVLHEIRVTPQAPNGGMGQYKDNTYPSGTTAMHPSKVFAEQKTTLPSTVPSEISKEKLQGGLITPCATPNLVPPSTTHSSCQTPNAQTSSAKDDDDDACTGPQGMPTDADVSNDGNGYSTRRDCSPGSSNVICDNQREDLEACSDKNGCDEVLSGDEYSHAKDNSKHQFHSESESGENEQSRGRRRLREAATASEEPENKRKRLQKRSNNLCDDVEWKKDVCEHGKTNTNDNSETKAASTHVDSYSASEQQEIYDAVHSLQILAKRSSPSRSSSSSHVLSKGQKQNTGT